MSNGEKRMRKTRTPSSKPCLVSKAERVTRAHSRSCVQSHTYVFLGHSSELKRWYKMTIDPLQHRALWLE